MKQAHFVGQVVHPIDQNLKGGVVKHVVDAVRKGCGVDDASLPVGSLFLGVHRELKVMLEGKLSRSI